MFGANALLDHTYYGEWTLPPVQFLRFNVLHSLSVFYGSNPWHYYLSQGLPLLLTSFLPVALFAIVAALRSRDPTNPAFQLAATSTAVIAVYSLISHKEVRFLHPLIPLLHPLVAKSIQDLPWPAKTRHRILALLVALNLPLAWYAGMVHQRGVVDVIHHLADTSADWSSAGFLMPCHSTPWCSTVGGRIPGSREMWALGCEPPVGLELEERNVYVDEADQFYADPVGWVRENLGGGDGKREWPERLVVFEALGEPWRAVMGYSECWRGWNSHWHDDWRRKGDVVVFCRDGA